MKIHEIVLLSLGLKRKRKKPKVYGRLSIPKSKLHKLLNKLIQN